MALFPKAQHALQSSIRSTTQIWIVNGHLWNFCARFSDDISRGNRWWRREIRLFSQAMKRFPLPLEIQV